MVVVQWILNDPRHGLALDNGHGKGRGPGYFFWGCIAIVDEFVVASSGMDRVPPENGLKIS